MSRSPLLFAKQWNAFLFGAIVAVAVRPLVGSVIREYQRAVCVPKNTNCANCITAMVTDTANCPVDPHHNFNTGRRCLLMMSPNNAQRSFTQCQFTGRNGDICSITSDSQTVDPCENMYEWICDCQQNTVDPPWDVCTMTGFNCSCTVGNQDGTGQTLSIGNLCV